MKLRVRKDDFNVLVWPLEVLNLRNALTYFSMQTISPEIFGKPLHVAGETPESVYLRVQNF